MTRPVSNGRATMAFAMAWVATYVIARMALEGLERGSVLGIVAATVPNLAVELNRADWSYRHLWPFMIVFWLAGLSLARRRYA